MPWIYIKCIHLHFYSTQLLLTTVGILLYRIDVKQYERIQNNDPILKYKKTISDTFAPVFIFCIPQPLPGKS